VDGTSRHTQDVRCAAGAVDAAVQAIDVRFVVADTSCVLDTLLTTRYAGKSDAVFLSLLGQRRVEVGRYTGKREEKESREMILHTAQFGKFCVNAVPTRAIDTMSTDGEYILRAGLKSRWEEMESRHYDADI
jgi:hypothetical protein